MADTPQIANIHSCRASPGDPEESPASERPLSFIDLFCGCGGFSLGMIRAGFRCLAAIDSNREAIAVFKANFPEVPHVLEKDLAKFLPEKLGELLGTTTVDVIVGGPPCQGFSTARQVDAANHGSRVKRDKRRYLYRRFLAHVAFFKPRVFVIENVLGIQSAAKGAIFTRLQAEARVLGYRVHSQVEEAWKLGVPQKRRRQLIVGVCADLPGYFPNELVPVQRAGNNPERPAEYTKLWDAIGDLPAIPPGGGFDEGEYDLDLRASFLAARGPRAIHYHKHVLEVHEAERLTGHRARPHNAQDLRDFARLREGEHSAEAIARGEPMEFTYNRDIFKDRYKRQHREELCSTIVAHLSKDGLMFIHPTQDRSLTPREAARVQSFPDWFRFPVPRTHQYRMIGNAVPPLVSEAIGSEVLSFLKSNTDDMTRAESQLTPLPENEIEAADWILPFLDQSRHALRTVPEVEFKQAWYAIAFLYGGLHPDGALDHGTKIILESDDSIPDLNYADHRLISPRYERSGWPVILAPIAREAWRRFETGALKDWEFYCAEAQLAGICHRKSEFPDPGDYLTSKDAAA